MCELFGFAGKHRMFLNQKLEVFFSHGTRHPDGWGLALLDPDNISVEKESENAVKSKYLRERLKEDICAKNALAHIRLATIGEIERKNSHPFVGFDRLGRRYTFIHNGTIFESAALSKYTHLQRGDTDSERILLYIVERMNEGILEKGGELSEEERFAIMDEIAVELSPMNKLNFLLFDGTLFYVHTNFKDSLYACRGPNGILFSTTKLDDSDWKPVEFTTLLAYRKGELSFRGTCHGNEFFEDREKNRLLYLAYSGL